MGCLWGVQVLLGCGGLFGKGRKGDDGLVRGLVDLLSIYIYVFL